MKNVFYPKIQSIYKRDDRGRFLMGQWSMPEFEYLRNCEWYATEKIDGTNTRVWVDGKSGLQVGGRTAKAQPLPHLNDAIIDTICPSCLVDVIGEPNSFILFGEGYGAKIQKCGKLYNPDGHGFILFDVYIRGRDRGWWLKRDDVVDIAGNIGCDVVPLIQTGDIKSMIDFVKTNPASTIGNAQMEGVVIRPMIDMFSRNGSRIQTKIKRKDFR